MGRRTARAIGFCDPRRFGCVDLMPTATEDAHRLLAALGPEPLEEAFTPRSCRTRWPASGRR
jgi:formamidopyrimidine-DNA glycosylase